jgi:hypothetical protein
MRVKALASGMSAGCMPEDEDGVADTGKKDQSGEQLKALVSKLVGDCEGQGSNEKM